jgi:PAS domain-containing protein
VTPHWVIANMARRCVSPKLLLDYEECRPRAMDVEREPRQMNLVDHGPSLDAPHAETLSALLSKARCILWAADVEGRGDWYRGLDPDHSRLIWKPRVINEAAAQRILPLNIKPGSNYFEAWRDSRHQVDDARMWDVALRALACGEQSYDQVFRCFDKDGREHWLHEDCTITMRGPSLWHIVGVAMDITPHWQQTNRYDDLIERLGKAIASRETSAAVLEMLLDSVPVGVALVSRDARFVRVNHEFCRMNAVSELTLTGEPITRWIDPTLARLLSEQLEALLAGSGTSAPCQFSVITEEGPRTWELRLSPLGARTSSMLAAGLLLHDVTSLSRQPSPEITGTTERPASPPLSLAE